MLSNRAQHILPSPTLALNAKVSMLKSEGIDVINLGIGEPDFETPLNIKNAAIKAIENGFTHYTETAGIFDLRKAIVKKFHDENVIDYSPSQVIVGSGSKQLLYNAFQILCDKGDEVLVPTPTWATYVEQVKLADAVTVFIPLSIPFKLTANDVEKYITNKTKILILNSPSNPTGAMVDDDDLEQIAMLAVKYNFWVISDEIYEKIIYGKKHVSIASLNKSIYERTITINGFSKAYAMTGWRIGYAAGNEEVIKAMNALQDQETSNPSSISQKAALEGLTGSQDSLTMMVSEFRQRMDYVTSALKEIKGLSFPTPEGAFYLFVSVENILKKSETSKDWCEELLEHEQVALTPGEAFYAPGYFRLSYAASLDNLKEAVKRIEKFIGKK